jgi:MYXO-CTERM domain-containing protein
VRLLAFLILSSTLATNGARAAGVYEYELDTLDTLVEDGWDTWPAGGAEMTLTSGGMRLQGNGPYTWRQQDPGDAWVEHATPERGWWIEASIAVSAVAPVCDDLAGIVLSLGDHWSHVHVRVRPEEVALSVDQETRSLPTPGGAGMHRYRVEADDEEVALFVDDAEVVRTRRSPRQFIAAWLSFGISGDCDEQDAVFSRFAFGTFTRGEEENDDDGDLVCNAEDNCPWTRNGDQADENDDKRGDVCDPCSTGELLDEDRSGTCERRDELRTLDTDGDGWLNIDDACPLVAGMAPGTGELADGCPPDPNAFPPGPGPAPPEPGPEPEPARGGCSHADTPGASPRAPGIALAALVAIGMRRRRLPRRR